MTLSELRIYAGIQWGFLLVVTAALPLDSSCCKLQLILHIRLKGTCSLTTLQFNLGPSDADGPSLLNDIKLNSDFHFSLYA